MSEDISENQESATAAEETGESAFAAVQADLEKFRDLHLRSLADLDNFRKRAAREKEDAVKFANAKLLERLFPVLDSFDLGLAEARKSAADSPILAGFEMVAKQLADFLSESGVQPVLAEGQPFDPNLHEAASSEHSDEVPEGFVIRQYRRGFRLHDRLLRPATVVVSKGPAA